MAVAIFLLGCQEKEEKEEIRTTEEEFQTKVEISINPELEIYLGLDNHVRDVICKNEDAKAACEGVTYEGLPFEHFLQILLDRCVQCGYLQDGSDISIVVSGAADVQQEEHLRHQAEQVIVQAAEIEQLTITAKVETPTLGIASFSHEGTPESSYAQEEYDSQGNLIGYQEERDDGTIENVSLDENGNIIKREEILPDGSGSMMTFNSQGLQEILEDYGPGRQLIMRWTRVYHSTDPLQYTETDMDGNSGEYVCDSEGNVISVKRTEPDGAIIEETFQNGQVVSELRVQLDGVRMVKTFQNGIAMLEQWTAPDGEVWEVHYAGGVITSSNGTMADGSVWNRRYEGTVEVYYRRDAPDGTYWEEHYDATGRPTYHANFVAGLGTGSATTYTYHANGNKSFESTVNADGSIFEVTYDSNGNPQTWTNTDANGVKTQGGFNAAGQPID